MRRKISLYVAGRLADISDQSFVLFNYAFTDLEKPTAVKNSFSQQITLPASSANDAIFEHAARVDRVAGSFNPLVRTPFTIYNDLDEVVESGYLRLDSVTRNGRIVTGYKVSLFGGLGSFFYSLSYNSEGDKMTLADLDYLGTANPATELDFTINKAAVQAAWDRLDEGVPVSLSSKWDIINFAPAYEGIPDGNFDASKGILTAADSGQPSSIQDDDGNTYSTQSGKVLVTLPEARDEWAVKDLRSYLQRPVFSMRALLEALANPDNNGGFTFDYSDIPVSMYRNLWKTLPLIPQLTFGHEESGSVSATANSTASTGTSIGTYTLASELDASHDVTATFKARPLVKFSGNNSILYSYANMFESNSLRWVTVLFFQMVAEDINGNEIGGSKVQTICGGLLPLSPAALATALGYTPVFSNGFENSYFHTDRRLFFKSDSDYYIYPNAKALSFTVETHGAYRWRLYCHAYCALYNFSTRTFDAITGGTDCLAKVFTTASVYPSPNKQITSMQFVAVSSSVTYVQKMEGRTGASISKSILLNSKYSPAEYLIGWAKMNGLVFAYDKATRTVKLHTRNSFFNTGQPVLDLSERVDQSKEITVQPLLCGSAWYNFLIEYAQGAFAQEYEAIYSTPFGIQKVKTGYEFNDAAENLMDGSPFRGAVTKLDFGKYWNYILVSGVFRPSVFLDPGTACVYWGADGKTLENPVSIPRTASVGYYNEYGHENYDVEFSPKLELRDADGRGVDGEDILVEHGARDTYSYFKLSDDTALMLTINDGVPCWDMDPGPSGDDDLRIPDFHRYNDYYQTWKITSSLDFGNPRELAVPDVRIEDDARVYARLWRNYLTDLLSQDTKVLKCRVNLEGLQVGSELFRRFFWFEGSVWVLNKINNHSLTTYDATECEFVQVQDMANYTNGQTL